MVKELDKLNRQIHLNIKSILKIHKIREKDVMELLDLSKGSANRLINGHRPIKLAELYILKEEFLKDCSYDDLFKASID